MLSLARPIDVDGVTVYRDHLDKGLVWVLPPEVGIARRPGEPTVPEFTFLMFKPAVAEVGVEGGGYAMFTATLELPDALRSRILSRATAEPDIELPVRIAIPPFDQGTAQVVALNLQGGGGTTATPAATGAFNAVELIQGATVPSMDAQNRAVFALTLSQEGAIILKQAFSDGMAPIGVIYNLGYLALRPALDVEITADFERIYTYFGGHLEGQYLWFQASIDAAFESLAATGAIDIKIVNQTGEADEATQQQWALDFFKKDLLAKWFEPTLAPGKLLNAAGGEPEKSDGEKKDEPKKDEDKKDEDKKVEDKKVEDKKVEDKKDESKKDDDKLDDPETDADKASEDKAGEDEAGEDKADPVLQKAALTKVSQQPDPLPEGRSVSHTPAGTGTTEAVTVAGAGATVTVDGAATTLSDGKLTVEVAAEATKKIEVSWPAGPAGPTGEPEVKTFGLFFDFDKPKESGWSVEPPSAEFKRYVTNAATDDPRFLDATGLLKAEGDGEWTPTSQKGADRLTAWIQSLPSPHAVKLVAYASHEDATAKPESERGKYNLRLSLRRLDVAASIVERAGGKITSREAKGDTVSATRPGAHSPMGGDPDNRVVHVIATVPATPGAPGTAASQWTGTIARPASVPPEKKDEDKADEPKKDEPKKDEPKKDEDKKDQDKKDQDKKDGPKIELPKKPDTAAVKLNLKFVRQEERKKLTFRYSSAEAVRRTVAPQGLLGLMLADLEDTKRIFTEVDLDAPFFRRFAVEVSAPLDYAAIGLTKAELAIDYGSPTRPEDHKHGELTFGPTDQGPKTFTAFLNSTHDVVYDARFTYEFGPQSGWAADAFTYVVEEAGTDRRTQVLNPFEHIEFREIRFEPGDIDWEVVSSIDVLVTASGYSTPEPRAQLKLTKDALPQVFRIRGAKPVPAGRQVSYVLRQNLVDGTSEETPPQVADLSVVAVNDLLSGALELVFVPGFDAEKTAVAFIDVEYHDPAHHYDRMFRQEVPGTARPDSPIRVRVALRDPALREYRYRLTLVGPNGEFDQRAWVTTSEQIIPVS